MSLVQPRVLMLDPSGAVAESAALALEAAGYIVFKATTHGQARMLLAACEDLEILVAHCDAGDGSEVGAFLADACVQRPDMAVVALSTLVGARHVVLPDYTVRLEKPFGRDELLAAVERARLPPAARTGT
jgi:DNA-binding response OmpR family regulator